MASQGLVTVMNKKGEVLLKIVAGCNGYKVHDLAEAIRQSGKVPSLEEALELSHRYGFGCTACLVAINESDQKSSSDDPISDLYRETFSRPEFNPRWESGVVDSGAVIHL